MWIWILIIIIIIIFIFLYVYKNSHKYELMDNISTPKQELSYADINDPYEMPYILENVASTDHCNQIMAYCVDKLQDSQVIGGKMPQIRNSKQCWIPKNNPLAKPLYDIITKIYNLNIENAEDLQVVRYQPGQYYNEHHDSCCENSEKCEQFTKNGGQRILTVLIYLNNDFDDGETYFRVLDKKIKADPGNAIVFHPLATNTNKCHPYALHAGLPVTRGEKWIANLWFRERPFNVVSK